MAAIIILKVLPGINNWQVVTYAATNDNVTYYKVEGAAFPQGDVRAYANANAADLYNTAMIGDQTVSALLITAYQEAQFRAYYGAILKSILDDVTAGTLGSIVIDTVINNAIVFVNNNNARAAWLNKYRALLGIGAANLVLNPAGVATLTAAQKANLLNVIYNFAASGLGVGTAYLAL